MTRSRDIDFLKAAFLTEVLPREIRYLYKYFRSPFGRVYVQYLHVFGDLKYFREHTGFACTDQVLHKAKAKYKKLVQACDRARQNMDFGELEKIEKGKFKLS